MPKRVVAEIIRTGLLEHPAVQAWSQLDPRRVKPEWVQVLKAKKSHVYRLEGVGPENTAVVAKRCKQETAQIERTVYENILPHLTISRLHFYGLVEEPGSEASWLFIEDAQGEAYSRQNQEHLHAAAEWVGQLHVAAEGILVAASLPQRDAAYYRRCLLNVRAATHANMSHPALTGDDRGILNALISRYDVIESHWGDVETFCNILPHTLVHGDLKGRNVHIRTSGADISVLPFDWELAGWGIPAADVAGFSCTSAIATYGSTVRRAWWHFNVEDIQRIGSIGTIFRCLVVIPGEFKSFPYDWINKPMMNLRSYSDRLADVLRVLGWSS